LFKNGHIWGKKAVTERPPGNPEIHTVPLTRYNIQV
jgi:hypothetical protein